MTEEMIRRFVDEVRRVCSGQDFRSESIVVSDEANRGKRVR